MDRNQNSQQKPWQKSALQRIKGMQKRSLFIRIKSVAKNGLHLKFKLQYTAKKKIQKYFEINLFI